MTNGIDHHGGNGSSSEKPVVPAKVKKVKAEVVPKPQLSKATQNQSKQ